MLEVVFMLFMKVAAELLVLPTELPIIDELFMFVGAVD